MCGRGRVSGGILLVRDISDGSGSTRRQKQENNVTQASEGRKEMVLYRSVPRHPRAFDSNIDHNWQIYILHAGRTSRLFNICVHPETL